MNETIGFYESYREEDRFTTGNTRRVEFLTTVRALEAWLPTPCRLLDCAAGTGAYALHFAAKGHDVTALDLTPRHVEVMREALAGQPFAMETDVNDATDLSRFADASFDAVLCMGPLYHIADAGLRAKCLAECCRVLRPGGLLAAAYISRFYVLTRLGAFEPANYLSPAVTDALLQTGTVEGKGQADFLACSYFATPEEAEVTMAEAGLSVVDHFAQDGLSTFFYDKIDAFTPAQLEAWCDLHYRTCREPTLIGSTNHGLVIGRKNG